jgi:hypothetical protein
MFIYLFMILTFLGSVERKEDESTMLDVHFRDISTGESIVVAEAVCLDLFGKAAMLRANTPIQIRGKLLGDVGREWLKLLALRHWAARRGKTYIVPKESSSDPAINSALVILEQVTNGDLVKCTKEERLFSRQLSEELTED